MAVSKIRLNEMRQSMKSPGALVQFGGQCRLSGVALGRKIPATV